MYYKDESTEHYKHLYYIFLIIGSGIKRRLFISHENKLNKLSTQLALINGNDNNIMNAVYLSSILSRMNVILISKVLFQFLKS